MKKIISLFLSFLMVVTMLPAEVLAEELFEEAQEVYVEPESEENLSEPQEENASEIIIEEEAFVESETLGAATVIASGNCGAEGDNLKWSLDKDGVLTISGTGAMADYSKVYDTDSYITTAPWGAYASSLKSLVVEKGVTTVGEYAFYNCRGFIGDLVIPESVMEIGRDAFYFCSGFNGNLVIPESVTKISIEAFSRCDKFTGNLVIPENTTIIEHSAFYGCDGFESLVLGKNVTEIGGYAFYSCNGLDKSLNIPQKVDSIGDMAFKESSVENFYFEGNPPSEVTVYSDSERSFNTTATIYYPSGNTLWENSIVDGKWNGYKTTAIIGGYCGAVGNEQNVKWSIGEDGVLTISGTGAMADYTWIQNAPWVEYKNEIIGLDIKNGVTNVGDYAFYSMYGIEGTITIPDSVITIGDYAFGQCESISKLVLGNKVETIGENAFEMCGYLDGTLTIPDSVVTIGDYAFENCLGLDGLILGKNVETIGNEAFYCCEAIKGNLVIPDSVTSIGESAFRFCPFDGTLTLSKNLTAINNSTFYGCKFSGELIIPENITYIGTNAFQGSVFSGDIVFPENLNSIGRGAFNSCEATNYYFDGDAPSVTGLADPERSLPGDATVYYYGHKNWTIDASGKWNGYTAVERGAVVLESGYCGASSDGKNLSWALYSDGVLTIEGTGAMADYSAENKAPWFEHSEMISSVVLKNGITSIGDYAFSKFSVAIENIDLPETLTEIGNYAFAECTVLTGTLVIPENVVTVGNYAFSGCTGITGLVVGNKTEVLGNHSFENCTGITSLNMGDGVEAIGDYAFRGCTGITYLDISSETVGIGNYAFAGCTGLSGTLTIPEKVTIIGGHAFEGCTGFTGNLKIPNSVKTIGDYAFSSFGHQSYYRTLSFGTGLVSIGNHAFDGAGFEGGLVLPSNVKTVGDYAFNDCDFTGSLLISGVETIGDHAFNYCKFTGTVTFGENLRKIGKNAFYKYSDITGYYFKGNVPEMTEYGDNASLGSNYAIHYPLRNETWEAVVEDERWNGYYAFAWVEGARACGYCGAEEGGKNLWWILSKENVLTIYGSGAMEEHTNYEDYPWYKAKDYVEKLVLSDDITTIGQGAFYGSYYTNLSGTLALPSKLKSIGASAFYNCTGFTGDLIIPDSVETMGSAVFSGCKGFNGRLVLSKNLKSIPYDAFYYCENFKGELDIPESVELIDSYAFYACKGFTGNLVFPEKLKTINNSAFTACEGFTGNLVFPESLELIGAYAFQGCYGFERDVIIPVNVKEIGNYAFNNSPTDYYYFAGDKPTIDLDKFNGSKEGYFEFSNVNDRIFTPRGNETWGEKQRRQWDPEVPGEYWGYCGEGLEWHLDTEGNLTISGTGRMEDYTGMGHGWEPFYSDVKTVTIEAGVEYIGKNAFVYCGTIDVYFEGNAPEVVAADESDHSFNPERTMIYYPVLNDSWEIVDGKWNGYNAEPWACDVTAFGYCGADADGKNLIWVIDKNGVLTISGTGAMADYTFKGSVEQNKTYAPWIDHADKFDKLVFEKGITSIGEFAFYKCENITGDLVIPESVEKIGRSAFFACKGFDGTLTISEGVKEIGETAFRECSGFTGDLIIPDSVMTMSYAAFYGTGFDGKLIIGKGLKIITNQVFWKCENLTGGVVLSENIEQIATRAFGYCGIDEFYFAGDAPKVENASSTMPSFDAEEDTLYYIANNTTWSESVENNLWNGYKALGSALGNLDGDDEVTVYDVHTARLIAARLLVPTEWQFILGDVDGDGRITALDCNYIRRFAIGIINEFPVENQ